MKERPILFQSAMVRALLAGTKTQTRRAIKGCWGAKDGVPWKAAPAGLACTGVADISCPYGRPGDRLWVRESTRMQMLPNIVTGEPTNARCGVYTADDAPVLNEEGFDLAWWYSKNSCPSIHMPRWASRILLEITEVRVQRLQEISEEDCWAEGIEETDGLFTNSQYIEMARRIGCCIDDAKPSYALLWEEINGSGSWALNPWVWAVSFRRIEP